MRMTRGAFLKASLAGISTLTLVGCGSESDDGAGSGASGGSGGSGATGSGGTSGGGGTAGSAGLSCGADIAANHGHTLVVSEADVNAGADKTYDIQGTGAHSHSVTLTAADFAQLAQGQSVTVESTSAVAHTHSVTVTCS